MISGLLKKDLLLISHRKNAVGVILLLAVVLNAQSGYDGFMITYVTFLSLIFAISTLNYDEFDNGFAFLMTLPASRKDFVKEKYILCIGMAVIACFFATVLSMIMTSVLGHRNPFNEDTVMSVVSGIALRSIASAYMIPIQLKYGQEKSRIALAVGRGLITLAVVLLLKIPAFAGVADSLDNISPLTVIAFFAAISVAAVYISCRISVAIWENKEF